MDNICSANSWMGHVQNWLMWSKKEKNTSTVVSRQQIIQTNKTLAVGGFCHFPPLFFKQLYSVHTLTIVMHKQPCFRTSSKSKGLFVSLSVFCNGIALAKNWVVYILPCRRNSEKMKCNFCF